MSQLCHVCRALPWHQLDRNRKFRYAWWKNEKLCVPQNQHETSVPLNKNEIVSLSTKENIEVEDEFCYHTTLNNIRNSSQNGCHFCRLAWTSLLDCTTDSIPPNEEDDLLSRFENNVFQVQLRHDPTSGKLSLDISAGDLKRQANLMYSFVSNTPGDIRNAFSPKLTLSPKSSHTFEVIRYWIQKCNNLHHDCPKENDLTHLPTRVIDVGSTNSKQSPFLYVSCSIKARYITLSHRWGLGKTFRTINAKVAEYQNELPVHEMSQVFRDAIELTRDLGIQYLWIDSICIIQDSPKDWEVESSKMANIYGNSWFTIAAALSDNIDTGLFAQRDPLAIKPCRVHLRSSTDSDMEIVRIWKETELLGISLLHRYLLYTRAWVFQEQALSPKILHFTPHQVYWECFSENYAESQPLRRLEWTEAPPKLSNSQHRVLLGSSGHSNDVFGTWLFLVGTYTARQLTYDTDRLPALSGIAKVILARIEASSNTDEYLAGLWNRDMIRGLVWYPDKVRLLGIKHTRPLTYTGPSWSWVAINGPISFPLRNKDSWRYSYSPTSWTDSPAVGAPCSTLLSAKTLARGLDPTGQISSAKLTILGPVCHNPFHLLPHDLSDTPNPSNSTWTRKDDPTNQPLQNPLFNLDIDNPIPPTTPKINTILLQLYPKFALILEPHFQPAGVVTYQRIGWCAVGEHFTSMAGAVSDSDFTQMEVVTII
ncbi:MAG: hypothetical protein M1834_001045 [Cirrosporium novae-zelandiae]|nr:MAG: hypothetical protein M1834_001045 [Cirrosporium novae-zelandiae]